MWLDDQGKAFVRITGETTFERVVPVQAKGVRLSFRVRVISGPAGGNPFINVAAMSVGARFPDAGDLVYFARVLQEQTTIELGCDELPTGGYVKTPRPASSSFWTSYALSYVPSTGKAPSRTRTSRTPISHFRW